MHHAGAADQHGAAAASAGDEHASSGREHRRRTDSCRRRHCSTVHRIHSPDGAHRSRKYCTTVGKVVFESGPYFSLFQCSNRVKNGLDHMRVKVIQFHIHYLWVTNWAHSMGHRGPLCHALSLSLLLSPSSSWTSMRACYSSDTWLMGVRRLAVANGPNIF